MATIPVVPQPHYYIFVENEYITSKTFTKLTPFPSKLTLVDGGLFPH